MAEEESKVTVIKNEVLKAGPLEEKHALAPVEIKQTPIGKSVPLICDNCYARSRCPQFKPGQTCVYITDDVVVETAADLKRIIQGLMAIQVQRINQARVIENLDGGYPDGSLSAEMDRFMEFAQILKDLGDSRDTIELKARGTGIISQIFGNLAKGKG